MHTYEIQQTNKKQNHHQIMQRIDYASIQYYTQQINK